MRPALPGDSSKPVPVLYLNDGQNLFDPARAFAGNTWRVAETVNVAGGGGRIPPILVVGIDHGEYAGPANTCRSKTSAIRMRVGRSAASKSSS